jgi:glycosyltransferase involved in cell wall biosynthesis
MSNTNVLFITAFHPGGKGVIGAGEAICEDSLRALHAAGKAVHVLALAPANQTLNPQVLSLCRSYQTLGHSVGQAFLAVLHGLGAGSMFAPWLFTRVGPRNIRAAREIIQRNAIDEVWLDFPSTLAFAPYLRELPIDYFAHDIVEQKVGRSRILGFLGPQVRKVEKNLLACVRRTFVLSEKDKALLKEMGYGGGIVLQLPQRVRIGEVSDALPVSQILGEFAGRKNLVFFGSMRRPENPRSIVHFLLFAYPKIRRCHKDVQFWVIGLAPRLSLRLLGRLIPGVRVVGAVDDPNPAFRAAALCVVPLRLGAGVKIKVLQMLGAGAKVVSSPVGGEGISPTPRLIVVPYDEIPESVCRALSNPGSENRSTDWLPDVRS